MILVFVLYAIFASSFWLTKMSLPYITPLFLTLFRGGLSGLFLLSCYFIFDKSKFNLSKKDWLILLAGSFSFSFFPNNASALALQHISSIKGAFYYAFSPFITAVFAYYFFKEKMTHKKWFGLFIGFLGVLPIMYFEAKDNPAALLSFSIYDAIMIVTVICYSIGWLIIKPLVAKDHSPFLINGLVMLGGGFFALLFSIFFPMPMPTNWSAFLPWGIALTIANNIISYTLYMYLLKKYSPVWMSLAGFSEYIFGILYGCFCLGEQITSFIIVSGILIAIGLYVFYQEELKEEIKTKKQAKLKN